jgi:hypothetical protein
MAIYELFIWNYSAYIKFNLEFKEKKTRIARIYTNLDAILFHESAKVKELVQFFLTTIIIRVNSCNSC